MKLRLLVKLVEKLLGIPDHGDEARADMFLPAWILALGIVCIAGAVGFAVAAIIAISVPFAVIAGVWLILGIAAVLCWRNQTIVMLNENAFEYSTMFGKKKVYYFSEIKGMRRNSDSTTLFVGEGKVHIESCAIFTERLINRINASLDAAYAKKED